MVQAAFQALLDALLGLRALVLPLAAVLGAGLLLLGLLALLDRGRARGALGWLGANLQPIGRWALVALAVGAGALTLHVARQAVGARLSAQQNARYANAADPEGGPTSQTSPRVTLLDTRTYSRSLVLPADVYARLQLNGGWETLLPYFGGEAGTTVQDLREGFTRRGRNLVYSRAVTLLTETPVDLDSSAIGVGLNFVDPAGGRGSYYNADFRASYAFTNPRPEPARARFVFPLPVGSGTLSGFRLTVDGQSYRASDLENLGGPVWEGVLAPGQTVKVAVAYRHQGARGWGYRLSGRREALRDLDLQLSANRPAKFERYSLYPTETGRDALGRATSLRWNLRDVITAQDIAVVFAQGSVRETLTKVGLLATLGLALLPLLALAWALHRRMPLPPLPLAGAVLGLGLGGALGGVLTAYLPLALALALGAAAGLALGLRALGRPYAPPLVIAALAPLAFLSGGHAGLLLTLLALAALTVLLRPAAGRAARA